MDINIGGDPSWYTPKKSKMIPKKVPVSELPDGIRQYAEQRADLHQLLALAKACGLEDPWIHTATPNYNRPNDEIAYWNAFDGTKVFDPLHNPADLVLVMKAMHECYGEISITRHATGFTILCQKPFGSIFGTNSTLESAWLDAAIKWSEIMEKEKNDEFG